MILARLTPLLLCAALAVAAEPAAAQRAVTGDLQARMSAQEFKAAGLDKLSPQELATLNDWLQGRIAQDTAAAREAAKEEGRQEVIVKNRGFFDFGMRDPIESNIVGAFTGFGKGKRYVLANGQEWEQTDASGASLRRQSPKVKIKPGLVGVWYLQVEGSNTQPKVRRVK